MGPLLALPAILGTLGTAGGLAGAAATAGTAASGIGTASALIGGASSALNFMYQSQVASNNAKIAKQDVGQALLAGQNAEQIQRLRTGREIGQEKSAQAANNIDVNVGSPVDVRQATANTGEMDALTIRYNARRQAYGYGIDASNYSAQAGMDKFGAAEAGVEGGLSGLSSYIGGATTQLNQNLSFKQAGIAGY